jgi:membrane-bound lytic murein transglycosylase D
MLDRKAGAAVIVAVSLTSIAAGCASRTPLVHSQPAPVVAAAPLPVVVSPPPLPADPIVELLAQSNRHFELGQRELAEGHLATAKTQFNRALEILMESPAGAKDDARVREQYDRLVERISTFELAALAKGDGFTEQKSEPASIDELLSLSTFDSVEATTETTRTVVEDLRETPHDIDIPLNEKVLRYVQLFSGRLKGYLEEGLSRGANYLPMIQDVFRAEGLPLDLAYVPLIESAFKTNALSKANAKGMWQFMKGTGLENGLKTDWYIDERSDPEKATVAAAKYLKTLHKMFGDWHLALASYNGGPGRVQRAMKRSKKTDFWSLTATTRYLPRETRDYVPLILAAVIIAKNPEQYGLEVERIEPPNYEVVSLPSAVDLRRIAEWSGAPVQEIQQLNPELRRWTTPVRANDYEIKVPAGTADLVRIGLLETSPDALAPLNRHTVKKGETLATISKKLKVNRADLAEANYLSTRARLTAGTQLIIPREPKILDVEPAADVLLASNTVDHAPAAGAAAEASRPAAPASTAYSAARATPEPAARAQVHRVKRGETLSSIAKRYGVTIEQVRTQNKIRGSVIQVGQRLTIEKSRSVATN